MLLKFGCLNAAELSSFVTTIEDVLFRCHVTRETVPLYKQDEVQVRPWNGTTMFPNTGHGDFAFILHTFPSNLSKLVKPLIGPFGRPTLWRSKIIVSTIQIHCYDEYSAYVDKLNIVSDQKARVRLFCLAFLTGSPYIEVGLNDRRRQGKVRNLHRRFWKCYLFCFASFSLHSYCFV